MSELEQAQELENVKGPKSYLYYGPPGAGKTTFYLYRPGKKILLDADNKAHEMENIEPSAMRNCTVWTPGPSGNSRLQVITKATKILEDPTGLKRVVTVINELLEMARECKRDNKPFPYTWAGLDSWSSVSDEAFTKVKFDQRVSQLRWQEWGLMHANNLEVLRGFLQLPCERVVIAHSRHVTIRDPETQEVKEEHIYPAIAGQLAETFAKYFTEVYFFSGREHSGDYRIQTVKDRLITARTAQKLPPEVLIDQNTKQLKL